MDAIISLDDVIDASDPDVCICIFYCHIFYIICYMPLLDLFVFY